MVLTSKQWGYVIKDLKIFLPKYVGGKYRLAKYDLNLNYGNHSVLSDLGSLKQTIWYFCQPQGAIAAVKRDGQILTDVNV
jgi:hypothetical protein